MPAAIAPTPGTTTADALANIEIQPPIFAKYAIVGALIDTPGIAVAAVPFPFARDTPLAPACEAIANCPVTAPAAGFILPTTKLMAETHLFTVVMGSVFIFGLQLIIQSPYKTSNAIKKASQTNVACTGNIYGAYKTIPKIRKMPVEILSFFIR
jgi:hypothetical protein